MRHGVGGVKKWGTKKPLHRKLGVRIFSATTHFINSISVILDTLFQK